MGRAGVRTVVARGSAASSYSLVELGAGTYAIQITANGHAGQSYSIAVSLAGATSSGFQVGPQDLATIRSLEGQRRGAPGYLAAADVNHDGRIDRVDMRLARLNLGVSTTIRPLAVTLGLGRVGGDDRGWGGVSAHGERGGTDGARCAAWCCSGPRITRRR